MNNFIPIQNEKQYLKECEFATQNPQLFWDKMAYNNFVWRTPWSNVLNYDLEQANFRWFEGAQLNITENCLDRHVHENPDRVAYYFEPNDPQSKSYAITYGELLKKVCRLAAGLRELGVKKGDKVCIYLPMIPELAISVLACARLGAVHSVVFAGFSAQSLASRINDCGAKWVITSDGLKRGTKQINLKSIVDEAISNEPSVQKVVVVKHTHEKVSIDPHKDVDYHELTTNQPDYLEAEICDAEDELFILYTSGSTGKPKGMVHTCGGYMVYTAYSFRQVFGYQQGDIYWCTADVGWITGHSYIVYGPLLNGATSVFFEGIPTYPDAGRFWEIIDKYQVNQFYTAPTAIRALAKEGLDPLKGKNLSSLKVLGTVGEPINEEAWRWYFENIGKRQCPVVDTWWQTETGGIMISPLPYRKDWKPAFASQPLPGISPKIVDAEGNEITEPNVTGSLIIDFPWPSIARSIYGDHQRYIDTYFTAFPGAFFTGDGAFRDESGSIRITGRVDDVIIVSGHNLGTAPIEEAINEHPSIAESAVVGFPHDIKGNALYGFITVQNGVNMNDINSDEINSLIAQKIGSIAKLDKVQFASALPKTRSGKIMRRILRKIAAGEIDQLGDTSTLLNPECVDEIAANRK